MRKAFLIAGLMAAFAFAVLAVSAAAPANFAGTWTLDKTKSQGLDPRMQNAESVIWTITQDDKQISIESKVTGGQPPAGSAPPGGRPGGGRGMGGGIGGPRTYNLDGKEVATEAVGGSTVTTKATWSSDGKTLELSTSRAGNDANGNAFKLGLTDTLSLSADGKALTVSRHSEGPRGTQDSTLVFNKQ